MGVTAEGRGITFRGDENALKLTVVMVTHLCEYVKPLNVLFKWLNCTARELHLSRAI